MGRMSAVTDRLVDWQTRADVADWHLALMGANQ